MASFNILETIICSCEVKNDAGTLIDPATSMTIAINQTSPIGKVIITATAMTKDSVGKYHYDFQTTTVSGGSYEAIYTATDGTRITIEKDTFNLV